MSLETSRRQRKKKSRPPSELLSPSGGAQPDVQEALQEQLNSQLPSPSGIQELQDSHMNGSAVGPDGDAGDQHDELPALSSAFRQRIRPVLNRIDELRSHGLQSDLKLPMVAVVGDQSVGKSSVLEAISGVEFPRGTGMVTRCALQLSMQWNADPEAPWHGRISYKDVNGHKVDKELNSPGEVDGAVREAQQRMTHGDNEISSEQIDLAIKGPDVPDLTLIDLPGIARYSATGGSGIAQITKSLIAKYVSQPQVLILVVVPCHQDIETVEALSLAKEADPQGERTIGVLTCPDMVNKGAEQETLKIANNEKIPLKKGYVMVKCRSPEELNNGVTLAESVANEAAFFKTHRHFSQLPEQSVGIRTLADKLTEELFESVKRNISTLQNDILEMRKKFQEELQRLGQPVAETKDEKRRYLFEMLSNFNKDVAIATQGEMNARFHLYAKCRKHWTELGKQIHRAWPGWVTRGHISHYWQPPEQVTRLITDLRGRELASYDHVFPIIERIYKEEFLNKLKQPAEQFLEQVSDEVTDVVHLIAQKVFGDFQDIFEVVTETSNEEIAKVLELARADLSGRLFLQEARVFSQDSQFQERIAKIEEDLYKDNGNQQPPVPDSAERIRRGLEAYLQVATERLSDTIPQSVLYFMFDVVSKQLGNRALDLLSESESAETFLSLLREPRHKTARRKQLKEMMEQLRLAQRDFNKFRL
ncbi:hypothetical protein BOX15_Mlig015345g1 [Macrostomum lignano]|uniref:Dynamin-type G domain-containing protein n=2 Tax=Macrostomum lignano TaxID=282301 RepID=A0A267EJZ1_9PLAT|nr:hypothetical protein BOX15_Mlig015345g1 [Macrostomum lignano]